MMTTFYLTDCLTVRCHGGFLTTIKHLLAVDYIDLAATQFLC